MKQKIFRIIGRIFIIAGLLIVLGSLGLNLRQQAVKTAAITEFKEQISRSGVSHKEIPAGVTKDDLKDAEEDAVSLDSETPEDGEILCILRIPSIDSENPVREGVSGGVLADSLGHEPGTAMAGETGNCVIAGHRNYTFGQFFNRLNEVAVDDTIYVDTATETYSYTVKNIKVVEPEDLSVLNQTEAETLTLYTCTPLYLATHRLVIVAERTY